MATILHLLGFPNLPIEGAFPGIKARSDKLLYCQWTLAHRRSGVGH